MAAPPFDFSSTIPLERRNRMTKKEESFAIKIARAMVLEHRIGNFSKLKSDKDRISYVKSLIDNYKLLDIESTNQPCKSAEVAEAKRNEGNECFKHRKFEEALQLYTESMTSAPILSPDDTSKNHLALSFSNRSAALFHLKKYKLCLTDIEEALQAGYPNDLQYKLYERKGKCLNALHSYDLAKPAFEKAIDALAKSHSVSEEKRTAILEDLQKGLRVCSGTKLATKASDDWDYEIPIPKLPAGCNTTHPSLTSACKVMFTEERGRHVVAERDIRPGEVILVEEPYSSILECQDFADHCHHCCRRYVVPMVCKQCTIVYYCSPKCRNVAWEQYHKYECSVPVVQSVNDMRLIMRTVLVTGLDKLLTYKRQQEQPHSVEEKHLLGFDNTGRYLSHDFNALYHLLTHSDALQDCLFANIFMAVVIIKCLKAADFFAGLPYEEVEIAELIVAELAVHLMGTKTINSMGIMEAVSSRPKLGLPHARNIGTAFYVTISLFNHACDFLTSWCSYTNIVELHANRTIKKGQEVTTSYIPHCFVSKKAERQESLKQYQFHCSCKACVDDWPLFDDLRVQKPLLIFKCQNCSHCLELRGNEVRRCPSCHKIQNLGELYSVFMDTVSKIQVVCMGMLHNGQFSEALPLLQNGVETLEILLATPLEIPDYVHSNLLLNTCFTLMGNLHIVNGEEDYQKI